MTNPLNHNFKLSVINSLYFDILLLPETHCLPNQVIEINNYLVHQHNRPVQGNFRRGSGGIAIAINLSVLNSHTVESVERGEDGQMSVVLRNVHN